ncbi:MAG TPA: protein kinase [Bryobacteraceae bacterium]|jgi:serine/threonine protein kinase|nr:protein kinase [Bryobacteraceae bacterium]
MSFATGGYLGPYKVIERLGEGGMGAVFRARDERLNRDVAVKVLHPTSVSDPECQRRFAQEARAVSALNHPNILTVHDIGEAAGWPYIVTELIDGESLSDAIARGAMPVRKFLELAVQCAAGLSAAHAAGIVHRDIKPNNIMIRRDGCVKILDFGIAKMSQGQTIAARNETSPGMVVGTANYMSPEQARGEQLDLRSDQFSLGLVFYRMLTGQAAFERSSSAGTMAAIIDDELPPISPTIPTPVRWAVERCLAKDRENRYASTADLYFELKHILERLGEITAERTATNLAAPPSRKRSFRAVGLSLAALASGLLSGMLLPPPASPDLSSYAMTPLATEEGYKTQPAWAPNGRDIAYSADVDGVLQIFVRGINSATRAQITRASSDCTTPYWSPDSSTIYYMMKGDLMAVGAAGGISEVVQGNVAAAAVSPGNALAFLRADSAGKEALSLWTASPPRAAPVKRAFAPLATGNYGDGHVAYSRDGSKLGVWLGRWGGHSEIWVLPVAGGEAKKVIDLPNFSHEFEWLPDNRNIVFGALAPGSPGPDLQLADTVTGRVRRLTVAPKDLSEPAVSPDGQKLAFSAASDDFDLMQVPLDGSAAKKMLATTRNELDPAWSPIADQYAYSTDRTGTAQIWLRSGQGDWERPVVTEQDFGQSWIVSFNETQFSWDGQRIAYAVGGDNGHTIWISSVQGGSPQRLASGVADQRSPSWSPDGSWVSFLEGSSARWTLKKTQPGGIAQPVVLRQGCLRSQPQWSKRGDWIACMTEEGLTLVSPDNGDSKVVGDRSWLVFGWNFAGNRIFGLKRTADRHTVIASIDIDKGVEKILGQVELPPYSSLSCFSMAQDEKSFLTSVNHPTADLWLLAGFQTRLPWWEKWRTLSLQ